MRALINNYFTFSANWVYVGKDLPDGGMAKMVEWLKLQNGWMAKIAEWLDG